MRVIEKRIKKAMNELMQKDILCDYLLKGCFSDVLLKDVFASEAYEKTCRLAMKHGNVKCYMSIMGKRAANPVFEVKDNIAYLSGLKVSVLPEFVVYKLESPDIPTIINYCEDMLTDEKLEIYDYGVRGDLVLHIFRDVKYNRNTKESDFVEISVYKDGVCLSDTENISVSDELYQELEKIAEL